MAKEVSVEYELDAPYASGVTGLLNNMLHNSHNESDVLENLRKFGKTRDYLNRKYGQLSCYANLYPSAKSRKMTLYFSLRAMEGGDESLEMALKELFSLVGTPYSVNSGSDYALAEKALVPYGKTLKKSDWERFFGTLVFGRKVVGTDE